MPRRTTGLRARLWIVLLAMVAAAEFERSNFVVAAEEPKEKEAAKPNADAPVLAKFLTVSGTLDERMDSRINNVALALQNEAMKRETEAVLVLEITRGTSKFGLVSETAKFLTSAQLSRVRTIAWIPERVDGYNVILALACKDIVMHPDAELGDIGMGQPLDKDEQQTVMSLIEKRHNPRVSPAMALAMMDPDKVLLKVSVPQGQGVETRVVTREELERLRENKVVIRDVVTLKEQGIPGIFTGSKARTQDFLVTRTAESRAELAEGFNLPRESLREDPWEGELPKVRLIKLDDEITPVIETFIERQIQRAVEDEVNLIIFEINSPGGAVLSSHNLANAIVNLEQRKIRTVAWISEKAISGAAMIAFACDEVYMTPQALIGDIIPISMTGPGGQFERAPEKIVSAVAAMLQDIAKRKNRSPALLMGMVDKDLKVYQATHKETGRVAYMSEEEIHAAGGEWTQGPLVPESREGVAITISGDRAHELQLAARPVQNYDELKKRLGISGTTNIPEAGRTWLDDVVFWLNSDRAMFFLIVIGVVCLYLELHLMTGLLGIIAAVCFALFFWSRFLGGTAGWLEVVLFLLGIGCLAMEIFVIPGFGVFGVSGGLMLLTSLVLASQTFGNLEEGADLRTMSRTVGTLTGAVVSVVAIAMLTSRFLPSIPILKHMILTPPGFQEVNGAPRLDPRLSGAGAGGLSAAAMIGAHGLSVSMLRPAGKAKIGNEYLDVVSEGPFIDPDVPVEVVRIEGNRVIVRQVS